MSADNEKKRLLEELEELSPLLHQLKTDGTADRKPNMPEGYFEDFSERMLHRLRTEGLMPEKAPSPTLFTLFRSSRFLLAAAAACTLLIAAVWFFRPSPTSLPQTIVGQSVELDADETEQYILEHIDEYEPELLAQQIPTQAVVPPPSVPPVVPKQDLPAKQPTTTPQKPQDIRFDDLSDEEIDALFRELAEDDILNML
jgi:hypothetical protein